MSNKSYTLADGSTVTVTATEQGIPFNEGMQALTKAIKARVAVRDGSSGSGGASSKLEPTLTVTANETGGSYTYNGDGEIFAYGEPYNEEHLLYVKLNRTSKSYSVDYPNEKDTKNWTYRIHLCASEGNNYSSKTIVSDWYNGEPE